jgi:Protein of unknown function (DUF3489)
MTTVKKTAEGVVPANKRKTKSNAVQLRHAKPDLTTVRAKAKKAVGLEAAAGDTKVTHETVSKPAAADPAPAPEAGPAKPKTTKQEQVLTMLSQVGGTTIDEIMNSTGWQQHSVRGFFAGTVRKKLGFELTSEKPEGEERRYAIKVAG